MEQAVTAAARRPIEPEDLYRFQAPGDPQISPDGTRVAFVVQTLDQERDSVRTEVWLSRLDGSECRRLTAGPNDRFPRWSPDGRRLAFISERSGQAQIWLISVDGGEAWRLPTPHAVGGAPVWAPDGQRLAYQAAVFAKGEDWAPYPGAPEGDRERAQRQAEEQSKPAGERSGAKSGIQDGIKVITRLKYRFDGVGYFGDRRNHIFVIDVPDEPLREGEAGPEPTRLTEGEYDHLQPAWSPDGRYIAFVSRRAEDADLGHRLDLWAVEVQTGRLVQLLENTGLASSPSFSPDGRYLAYLGHDGRHRGSTTQGLWVIPFEPDRGAPLTTAEAVHLTASLDRPAGMSVQSDVRYLPEYVVPPRWAPDGRLFTLVADRGVSYIAACDVERAVAGGGGTPQERALGGAGGEAALQRITPEAERVIGGFDVAPDGRLVYQATDSTTPDELYAYDPATGEERALTGLNRALLDEVTPAPAERFRYTGADGWSIDGWLIRPVGYEEGRSYPTVLFVHGGPHGVYGPAFNLQFQVFASRGYAVIYTNPRGSQTYGQDFALAVVGDWGGKDYHDIMAGVDYAIEIGVADPERLAVTGWSYGGFMTNWIVTQTDRFKAACTGACVFNRHNFWGTSDIGYNFGGHQFGGTPWEHPDRLLERSPSRFAERITTPMLILHGENDLRCPIEQAEQLFVTLRFMGREAVLVRYPGESHALRKPSHRVDRLRRMLAWFDHHLSLSR